MVMTKAALQRELKRLESANLSRRLRLQESTGSTRAVIDGRDCVLFAANDYLGLADHPRMIAASAAALAAYGCSARASRLVSGNHELYRPLEEGIARLKGKEAALVFPSGYMANLGFLAAMAGPGDVIHMDRLGHASLYDGCRLSGAKLKRYRHNDTAHLEERLKQSDQGGMIITDGVFSMDGDTAPLKELERIAQRYSCLLAIDDAHGTGVLGPGGRGTAAYLGAEAEVEIGTLSKACGSLGGFIAGSRDVIEYLVNKARTFIFSTGLPPAALAAAAEALKLFAEEGWRQERVLALAKRARLKLTETGFVVPDGVSPIIPLITGDEAKALRLSTACLERGVFIPAIRTPAVPPGQARLRMTLSAAHSDDELDAAVDILTESAAELEII